MDPALGHSFELGDRKVFPLEGKVAGAAGDRRIHPKVMEVLLCLAERPGEVVRREDLLDRVWGHHHGSDRALTRCISELRRALGDRDAENRLIETIPKRGYRLLVSPDSLASADSPDSSCAPSVAVLPFVNMSGDTGQEFFSDGISEDIITELSRMSSLFVIARNSTFTFKGRNPTIEEVSRELGARYVLEGSVRRADSRIRITAQLADAMSGQQIWAERYDRELLDVFAVQDDVVEQIVAILAVTLTPVPPPRARLPRRAPKSLEAYEYALRGRELVWLHKRETGMEARRLLQRAIWLDPGYAAAYSWLAFSHAIEYVNQWSEQPQESLRLAYDLAKKAVRLDESDAQAHFVLAECHLWAGREHDAAMDRARRAIELEPNYSHAHLVLGHALHYAGRSGESLEHFDMAMRLDPCYPDLYLHFLAQSYYSLGRYEDAVEALLERLGRNPETDISNALLAACYGRLGQKDKATSCWETALEINPGYSLERKRQVLPYKHPDDFENFARGLRAAGLIP